MPDRAIAVARLRPTGARAHRSRVRCGGDPSTRRRGTSLFLRPRTVATVGMGPAATPAVRLQAPLDPAETGPVPRLRADPRTPAGVVPAPAARRRRVDRSRADRSRGWQWKPPHRRCTGPAAQHRPRLDPRLPPAGAVAARSGVGRGLGRLPAGLAP